MLLPAAAAAEAQRVARCLAREQTAGSQVALAQQTATISAWLVSEEAAGGGVWWNVLQAVAVA